MDTRHGFRRATREPFSAAAAAGRRIRQWTDWLMFRSGLRPNGDPDGDRSAASDESANPTPQQGQGDGNV